jgi:hypothetical protein
MPSEIGVEPDDADCRSNAVFPQIHDLKQQEHHGKQNLIQQAQHEGQQRRTVRRDLMTELTLDQLRPPGSAVSDRQCAASAGPTDDTGVQTIPHPRGCSAGA